MAKSKYSALGLPEYLFQEQSKTSPQISPDATFDPVNAIGGGGGFVSQTAPNQQPKKKEIYLDYKSIFRLWKPENVALVIAKLKKEGFEVAFIQNLENGEISASKIDDSTFKDKNGKSQNVFGLSDDFIKDNFSQQTHEESIKKLNLARDDSIILDYAQFKEIHSLLTQENWADKSEKIIESGLSRNYLEGSTEINNFKSYKQVIQSLKSGDNESDIAFQLELTVNLLYNKDFDIQDPNTIEAICLSFNRLGGYDNNTYPGILGHLDEKTLGNLFDATPFFPKLSDEQKISLQKEILKNLWFIHSNFEEGVVNRAKTLEEFKNIKPHEIGISLYENLEKFSKKAADNLLINYSIDISERYPEEEDLKIFTHLNKSERDVRMFSFIAKQQKEETAFGQKIKVNFNESKGPFNTKIIGWDLEFLGNKESEKPSQPSKYFISIFSNSEINQHFDLTEKFGDSIIADLKNQPTLETFSSLKSNIPQSNYPKFFEQLTEDQRRQFLNTLQEKAHDLIINGANLLNNSSKKSYYFQNNYIIPALLVAQNNLDIPIMKELAKTMLIELIESSEQKSFGHTSLTQLRFMTPEFQDLLIEMNDLNKINLNKIQLHAKEEIFAKFYGNLFDGFSDNNERVFIPRDIYLEHYKKIIDSGNGMFLWDKSKVSSEKLLTSPLQINLFDLNSETLKKIKDEIDKGDLDAKNILSLKIFGIEREKTNKSEEEVKLLLEKLVGLFTNLKHVRVDIRGIEAYDLSALNNLKEKGVVLEKYNSSKLKTATTTNSPSADLIKVKTTSPKPQEQFNATKQGDKIYMGDSGSGAEKYGEQKISIEEAGEIINRQQKTPLKVRDSSSQINPYFSKLEDNLLVKNDNFSSIDLGFGINKERFEKQKKELSKTNSLDQTICSFTRNLKKNKKITLPSISPDNQIIGYYTNPTKANVTFFKDEKSGFYCAKSSKNCQIHYIIQGHELKLRTPEDNLDDLPDNVKKILNQYGVGDTTKPFPFGVSNDEYTLPDFENKDQFLNELFKITNKGSCLHRVASLAHRFTEEGLQYGADFRIIGIRGTHVLFEINKGNEWITLDMGGEGVEKIEKETQTYNRITLNMGGARAELIEKETKTYNNCFSALANSFKKSALSLYGISTLFRKTSSPAPKEEGSSEELSKISASLGFTNTKQENPNAIPSASPSSPSVNVLLIKNELAKRNRLTKIEDLSSFEEEFKKSLKAEKSSLFLKTTRGEELKNYLLKMGSSLQDSEALALPAQSSAKSFETFCISSLPDLTVKKLTLGISQDISQDPSQDAQIAKITDTTPLFSFLKKAKTESAKQHVLIIDWGKFNASSQVAFNTIFDKNDRKIDDQKIPDNVTIVCIDSSNKKIIDSSILSRFDKSYDLSSIGKNQYTTLSSANSSQDKKIIGIDGEGFVSWKEKLFGRVVLNCDKMEWQKSDFVKNLEQKSDQPLQLNFKNFSSEQQKEMKLFFAQGKSSGSINYHDYKIKIPSDLIIHFEKKEFEFTEVLKSFESPRIQDSPASPASQASSQSPLTLKIYQGLQASKDLPKDIHLINSYLFDKLLAQPKIEDNLYKEELGLIKQAKESDSKTLKLFLSENLSNQQFYCLLNQAKQHQVSLELYLAKDFKMPDKGFDEFIQKQPKSAQTISSPPPPQRFQGAPTSLYKLPKLLLLKKELQPTSRIIITNDIEKSLKEFKKNQSPEKALNLVNIEDVLYGDLFEKNQHRLVPNEDGTKHFSFKKIESDIKTKLGAKEIVVLKGQFSDELLSILHPQILDIQQKFSNLHFIIEDKNISESKLESTKLSWLDQSLYKVKPFPKTAEQTKTAEQARNDKIKAGKFVKEQFDCVGDQIPENSFQKAQEFIDQRKANLKKLLDNNSALQIFGHSGVGKSSLFRELKKDGVKVYDELSSFESWAENKNQGKPKILVIDEFNVDGSTNFTTFRDLANNPNSSQRIFHQGKFYDLDKNHKVVFLGNPKSYGNRFEQKLFKDCEVAEWHLNDFPTSYIYENILKKPIFKGLSGKAKNSLTENNFKEIAIEKIKEYKATNQFKPQPEDDDLPKETVRELQEKVLKEIVKTIPKTELGDVKNTNFIATESNKESIEQLQSAIQIRQLQKSGEFPPQFLGTCGVIFEGDSGVGKSVMIEAVLENRGITKVDSLEDLERTLNKEKLLQQETEITPETKPHYYYKIPASLPIEEIKKNLIRAFELGVIVVFDEMNTRIKEGGLEKDINTLLTGQHPTSSEIKPEAGFMIIASVNQATHGGRSNFSSAIEHRSNMISAKPLSEYQAKDFEKIITNWIENDKDLSRLKPDESTIKDTAKSFKEGLLDKDLGACNLRDLKESLQNIWRDPNSQKIIGHG